MKKAGEKLVLGIVAVVFLVALVFLLNFEKASINAQITEDCTKISKTLEGETIELKLLERELVKKEKEMEEFVRQNAPYAPFLK
ncbi:MAG TPA: hypothetical protein VI612_02015 [Candidatus Nanoarchaeia archaeon]|nr:hypothetical protein [Candidatus Nanoarchaeia archaeon]